MEYFLLIIGLSVLIIGGEFLVKGAVDLALRLKLSPLVVGMTVVSFGTSAPELLVSIEAALGNHPAIAIGNVIGSNISNLGLVLGITTLIFPITVASDTIKWDWPMMMMASIIFYLCALNGMLERIEGVAFVSLLIIFILWLLRQSGQQRNDQEVQNDDKPMGKSVLLIIIGCFGLTFGASWLLEGAITIAAQLGVSEHVIGVTIVAFGTSVPELTTSCIAAFRKQTDISVGNLIGSNLFNILAILGITSIIKEIPINDSVLKFDMWWMLGISFLILPMVLFDKRISRWRGAILFGTYLCYVFFLI